jgi:hypothetical protein
MSDPNRDHLPLEWLAAYADSELTPAERDRVENWLADHPEAHELLESQESLAPWNREFWRAVEPPSPSSGQWTRVRNVVTAANPVRPSRPWLRWFGAAGLLATAASLLILSFPDQQVVDQTVGREGLPTVSPAVEPIAMATTEDVQIISLPESAAKLLVVGEHPLSGSSMSLARFGEVEFYGIGADIAGRFPEMPADRNTEDIPIVWAPRAP